MNAIVKRVLINDGFAMLKTEIEEIEIYLFQNEEEVKVVILGDLDKYDIASEKIDNLIRRLNSNYEMFNTKKISCTTFFFAEDINKASELCRVTSSADERYLILEPNSQIVLLDYQTNPLSDFAMYIQKRMDGESVKSVYRQPSVVKSYLTPVNLTIIIANILVFIFMEMKGSTLNANFLMENGGLYWKSLIYDHEYYRLFTAMFMHSGIEHLSGNMFSLFFIGGCLEQAVGKGKYLLLYFTSGILAGVTSVIYNMDMGRDIVCVGASGAIFGVVGSMIGVLMLNKKMGRKLGIKRLLVYAVFSLAAGVTSWDIDNAAHVGGIVAGFLCSLVLLTLYPIKEKRC